MENAPLHFLLQLNFLCPKQVSCPCSEDLSTGKKLPLTPLMTVMIVYSFQIPINLSKHLLGRKAGKKKKTYLIQSVWQTKHLLFFLFKHVKSSENKILFQIQSNGSNRLPVTIINVKGKFPGRRKQAALVDEKV
jgi:hypothetical protein